MSKTTGRDTFILNYLAAFMATRAAMIYDDCCGTGDHGRLNNPPVEDEIYIATCAWLAVSKFDFDDQVDRAIRMNTEEER